jgi:hypothetical protein
MSARRPMTAAPAAGAQHADHAGAAEAFMHLDAGVAQRRATDAGAGLFECQFGMRVQIAPDTGPARLTVGQRLDQRMLRSRAHCSSSTSENMAA